MENLRIKLLGEHNENFAKGFILYFFIAVYDCRFWFNLKTNPYKFAKGDQVVDTDGRYIMPGPNHWCRAKNREYWS